jgi:hypothetical protein
MGSPFFEVFELKQIGRKTALFRNFAAMRHLGHRKVRKPANPEQKTPRDSSESGGAIPVCD